MQTWKSINFIGHNVLPQDVSTNEKYESYDTQRHSLYGNENGTVNASETKSQKPHSRQKRCKIEVVKVLDSFSLLYRNKNVFLLISDD